MEERSGQFLFFRSTHLAAAAEVPVVPRHWIVEDVIGENKVPEAD